MMLNFRGTSCHRLLSGMQVKSVVSTKVCLWQLIFTRRKVIAATATFNDNNHISSFFLGWWWRGTVRFFGSIFGWLFIPPRSLFDVSFFHWLLSVAGGLPTKRGKELPLVLSARHRRHGSNAELTAPEKRHNSLRFHEYAVAFICARKARHRKRLVMYPGAVTRLDGVRGNKHVSRPHVRTRGLSGENALFWRKYSTLRFCGARGIVSPFPPSLRPWIYHWMQCGFYHCQISLCLLPALQRLKMFWWSLKSARFGTEFLRESGFHVFWPFQPDTSIKRESVVCVQIRGARTTSSRSTTSGRSKTCKPPWKRSGSRTTNRRRCSACWQSSCIW